ncbi:MAG: zinc metalloprotease HtpX [Acidimicrobiales bacterium]
MFRNTAKTFVLLAALGGVMVGVGSLFGRGGAIIGLMLGLGVVGFSYWKSDTLAIRSARAEPASEAQFPQYFAVMRELTTTANMPMPRLYITPALQPNAFATGRNPNHAAVAITVGLTQVCSWEEIRGVLAHELAHVRNRDILIGSVAAAVATAISFIANIAMWGAMFGGGRDDDENHNPIVLIATAMLAPISASLIQMAISRSREFEADRTGAALAGSGEPLARALEKLDAYAARVPMNIAPSQASHFIVNPLAGRHVSFQNLFRTHPSTEQRVARLRGVMAVR